MGLVVLLVEVRFVAIVPYELALDDAADHVLYGFEIAGHFFKVGLVVRADADVVATPYLVSVRQQVLHRLREFLREDVVRVVIERQRQAQAEEVKD